MAAYNRHNMINKGLLIILSGPSGVGKGSVRQKVMEDQTLNLAYSVSLTTRKPREGEVDGKDYFFVSEKEFKQRIKEGQLLEFTHFVKHSYGTPKDYVEKLRNEGKNVLLEIEINGAQQVMRAMKKQKEKPVSIFILPPSIEELERRIRGRCTECEAAIQERLKQAKAELKLSEHYQYRVINDTLEDCAQQIIRIIHNEILKHSK